MKETSKELLLLLEELLCDTLLDFTIKDQKALYQVAKDNGLSGSIYSIMSRHVSIVDEAFTKDFYLYVSQDQKQMSMIDIVTSLCKDNNIPYKLLKGSIMKNIYPESYMRAMGDVDILLQKKDIKKIQVLLEEKGFVLDQEGPVHDHYQYGDLELEVHKRLRQEELYPDYSILDDIWDDDTYIEMELIFLLFHLKKHIITSGIGLRSVIDISLYLEYHLDSFDLDKVRHLLERSKSTPFFEHLVLFCDRYLNKNLATTLGITRPFNLELYESFTSYIIQSGIHGLGMSFNNFLGRLANNQNQGLNKKKSFIRQVFLPYQSMKYMYPKLLRWKIFLPIAWFVRIVRVVFKQTNHFLIRIKLYKVDQDTIDEAASLFQEMGI